MPLNIPTQAQIIARCAADFRSEAGVNPLRRSIEYALIRAQAGQSKGLYQALLWVFRQSFPGTAEDAYFWRWAAIWGIEQKAATPWQGTVRFTGTDTTEIPEGTELSRSDGSSYVTAEVAEIGSSTTGLVDVAVEASDVGTDANLDAEDPLTLAVSISGVDSDAVVQTTTIDGTDAETVDDALVRLLARTRTPSVGGGIPGDYVTWALEVPGVTRAWESSPAPGIVYVSFVRDNDGDGEDIIPDAGEREEVLEYVQAEAPITVEVEVQELTALLVEVEITDLVPDTSAVRDAIEVAVQDFFATEAKPKGTIFLSRLREAISGATGETSHTLVSPTEDVVATDAQIPIFDGLVVS